MQGTSPLFGKLNNYNNIMNRVTKDQLMEIGPELGAGGLVAVDAALDQKQATLESQANALEQDIDSEKMVLASTLSDAEQIEKEMAALDEQKAALDEKKAALKEELKNHNDDAKDQQKDIDE